MPPWASSSPPASSRPSRCCSRARSPGATSSPPVAARRAGSPRGARWLFAAVLLVVVFYGSAFFERRTSLAVDDPHLPGGVLPRPLAAVVPAVSRAAGGVAAAPLADAAGMAGDALPRARRLVRGGAGLAADAPLPRGAGLQRLAGRAAREAGPARARARRCSWWRVVPAICEEVAFRGVVLGGLRRSGSRVLAVVGSALVFGLFHINPYHVVSAALVGLLLAYVALESGSIVPGMVIHLVNNGFQSPARPRARGGRAGELAHGARRGAGLHRSSGCGGSAAAAPAGGETAPAPAA